MEEKQPQNTINIAPISKGKRILTFLADFFLLFILTFIIFNVLVMPVGNVLTKSSERQKTSDNAAMAQFNILYEQKVMLHEDDNDLYYYNSNVEYTMNCWLSYYSFSETDILETHKQYGNKEENEVIRHFYRDIRNDDNHYISTLQNFNNEYDYFNIEGTNVALKDDVKTNIKLSFFSPDDMSTNGKTMLANMQNAFMNLYADVFKDIGRNDLIHNGNSYLANKRIVKDSEVYLQWQLVISSLLSYLLSIIIYFAIIPLFIPDGRTLAMLMMRLARIGTNNLYLLNKGENAINAIYMLAFNLPVAFFMPMTYVAFTYLFNIPVLFPLLIIGLVLALASFIMLLASSYNRTICDYLSHSVIIKNDDLDEIYRSKGYDI